jgi:hypothetical protein
MLLLTSMSIWLVAWAHVRQTLHKLGGTLKFCISSSFANNMCILLRYSTRKFGIHNIFFGVDLRSSFEYVFAYIF